MVLFISCCVETPQKIGRVERKHQHILNVSRALFFQSKLPPSIWSYFILHVVFLINRVLTPIVYHKSPYHILHNKAPALTLYKVFGCLCNTPFSQHKNFFKKNSMHQSKHVNRASHILKHLMLMNK